MKKKYIKPETVLIQTQLSTNLMAPSHTSRESEGGGPTGPISDDDDDSGDESLGKWHRNWDFGGWE